MDTTPIRMFALRAQRSGRRCIGLAAFVLLAVCATANAQNNSCPNGFDDTPALKTHLSQDDIAGGKLSFKQVFDQGRRLFITNFNKCDGAGRPGTNGAAGVHGVGNPRALDPLKAPRFTGIAGPDSSSCASCHSEPEVGGAASFRGNLFSPAEDCNPVVPGVVIGASIFGVLNASRPCKDFIPTVSDGFFNLFTERGSLGLFGSGAIELLSREMTDDLQKIQSDAKAQAQKDNAPVTVDLVTKGVNFGKLTARVDGTFDTSQVDGVSPDLVVRPMGRKGQNKSIRHFSLEAFNRHLGMQPDEALEQVAAGNTDPDLDGVTHELTTGDITAVMVFEAALPVPRRVTKLTKAEREQADRGEQVFSSVGCVNCHMPSLPLRSTMYCEPNPRNNDGDFRDTTKSFCFDLKKTSGLGKDGVVHAFTDLKRHAICDPTKPYDPVTNHFCDDPPLGPTPATDKTGPGPAGAVDRPKYYQFLTAKLWDTGNSGPWGHRNDLDTIYEAITAHGGEAAPVTAAFEALPDSDQAAIVAFLKTLRMPIMKDNPLPQEEDSPSAPNPAGALARRAAP